MMLTLRKNFRYILALIGLAAIALAVASYILAQQGARIPFLSEAPVRISAILESTQAVTPGQGQTVQVAGVQVGKIAKVELEDGRAKLGLDIEPKYIDAGLIKTDATALLRPRTPLRDMYLQVLPGKRDGEAIRKGFTMPLQNTMTDVTLDQILAALDSRTTDYLTLLLNGTGKGLKGRGGDLAEVFRRFEPTFRDLGRVNRSVAGERVALRRLVSSLASLNGELAERPEDLSGLVTAANATFGAFASEDENLKATVSELPATLKQASKTLREVAPLARELGPATRALTPAIQALDRSNARVRPLAREATPIIRRQIRPFVRASRPLVRDLAPTATNLAAVAPELQRSTRVLNRFFNLFAFNKDGREAPEKAGRDEGYLFWLAWATHQGANLINTDDANGPMRGIFLTGTCTTLTTLVDRQPELEFGMGISPLLATACGNPSTSSIDLPLIEKRTAAAARSRAAAAKDEG
jgi:phospholipid/cholesterol/gamma-HCH transport system substrate-binding protein